MVPKLYILNTWFNMWSLMRRVGYGNSALLQTL